MSSNYIEQITGKVKYMHGNKKKHHIPHSMISDKITAAIHNPAYAASKVDEIRKNNYWCPFLSD